MLKYSRYLTILLLLALGLTACGSGAQSVTPTPQRWNAPDQVIDPAHAYRATLTTAKGKIVIDLFPKTAPKNVNAFVFLAQKGYYNNITFHRVLTDFMAQTGDPTGTGSGSPGFTVPLEVVASIKYDQAGRVGMARASDPNSAGSQFFITFGPQPGLNPGPQGPGYTIIGQVSSGMDVVRSIKIRDPETNPNFVGDTLVSVTVEDVTGK